MKYGTEWFDFIAKGKKPAILLCKKPASGISVGLEYKCWRSKGHHYMIWNNAGNCVKSHKACFTVLDDGDVLKTN